MYAHSTERGVREIINDVLDNVKTPTPPLPDLDDPEVCKREFEEKNMRYNFYYTPMVVELWHNLRAELYQELFMKIEEHYWDLNVDSIAELIQDIKDEFRRGCFERRYRDLFHISNSRPIER